MVMDHAQEFFCITLHIFHMKSFFYFLCIKCPKQMIQLIIRCHCNLQHPDILFFDEPTSALDPELTGEILKVIRTLAEEHMTMVVVTHEMAFARDVADQVVFMDGGVIVEQGDARQVIEHPREERTRQFLARYSEN